MQPTNWPYYLGSFMEIPKNLQAEIKSLEEQLTVPKEKLKAITEHFIAELDKGMFSSSKALRSTCGFLTNICCRSER